MFRKRGIVKQTMILMRIVGDVDIPIMKVMMRIMRRSMTRVMLSSVSYLIAIQHYDIGLIIKINHSITRNAMYQAVILVGQKQAMSLNLFNLNMKVSWGIMVIQWIAGITAQPLFSGAKTIIILCCLKWILVVLLMNY